MARLIVGLLALIVCGTAVYFYFEAQEAQRRADELLKLTVAEEQAAQTREPIWISASACQTTLGTNAVALCEGLSLDTSVFLDSGADEAVKACYEHTAQKLGRPKSDAVAVACDVKEAYGHLDFEWDSQNDKFGIQNTNYNILNEWLNPKE